MQTNHHLNEQLLMGYAAGVLPEAFDLVVATHLCLSDESRALLGTYETIGGCVMSRCVKAKMGKDALAETLMKIKACSDGTTDKDSTLESECACKVLPDPLRKYVGGTLDSVIWEKLEDGTKRLQLVSGKRAIAQLHLVYAGRPLQETENSGSILTLALFGAFTVGKDRFERGDIRVSCSEKQELIVTDAASPCVYLTASETGDFARDRG